MHPAVIALGLFTALMSYADPTGQPTLILYADVACQTQTASYTTSDSDEQSCVSLEATSGAYSFEIANPFPDCSAAMAYNYFELYEYAYCPTSGNPLASSCYVSCTSLNNTALNSYRWSEYNDPADPP